MRNEVKFGNYGPISSHLAEAIEATVAAGKQVVLFLNRRGFSGSTTCKMCVETHDCPHCDVPMKLHRNGKNARMVCHICGYLAPFTDQCPHCEAEDFIFRGWGTQQVEQELKDNYPGLRVLRADADSMGGKHDFRKLCEKFAAHEADVLLGTQMVAKGLDFEKVALVGVILADVGLSLPDFRAEERSFQLLTQVSGRAGRRNTQGNILIQTFKPDEKVFSFVKNHDTGGFLDWQRTARLSSGLPPFGAIAKIGFSDVDKKASFQLAQDLFREVKKRKDCTCNFAPAFWPRTHGKYHFRVFIQTKTREELYVVVRSLELSPSAKIDINPASLL
jgi:primosomal protein N' (replication factor Y)